jgi:hypothetical protein
MAVGCKSGDKIPAVRVWQDYIYMILRVNTMCWLCLEDVSVVYISTQGFFELFN